MMDVKWFKLLVCYFILLLKVDGVEVPIIFVQNGVVKGAVCLDGSPPAYHFDKGFGSGINNWLIALEGGAWCNDAANCLDRSKGGLGSSKLMTTLYTFSGIVSNNVEENPDFYNWNRVIVRYCDGSSYTGDVEEIDPVNKIYYRGARVWRAIMDDLLAKGMQNSEKAILAGCSAGGLGAILQCDNFRALLPSQTRVKCLSDAGFFINVNDISGVARFLNFFSQVVDTHGSGKNLPASCVSEFSPELCFFPQYAARFIQTPLFLLNAAYDSWQINNILVPGAADPHGSWNYCKKDITNCSDSQLQIMHGFRKDFLAALSSLGDSTSRGWYINSCYAHCQSGNQGTWLGNDSPLLNNTTISKAIGDWFYDRKPFQEIDCRYPCDKTCHNDVLK